MPTITLLPFQSYPIGTLGPAEANLQSNITQAALEIDITQMTDPSQHYRATFDLSLDDGQTWASENPDPKYGLFPLVVTRDGGINHDKNGVLTTQRTGPVLVPGAGSSTRRIRGAITISGGPITLGAQTTVT